MRQNQALYSEIIQNEIHGDPTPPPAATSTQAGGDGGGLTATERHLLREGFSTRAAREFRYNLELPTIITSNRAPEQLDQRILSRMYQRAFSGEIWSALAWGSWPAPTRAGAG